MSDLHEPVIVSAVRTGTGKFLGSLKGFTAPQLGALVVAEAVRRAGIDPAVVDECIMGNVVCGRPRPEPGAAGGAPRRPVRRRRGAEHQQGVRLGTESRDARRAGHRDRRRRRRRRRRHGVDEQLPLSARRACAKACAWATARSSIDDQRRPVVRLRGVPHGQRRRDGCRVLSRRPRGTGRASPRAAIAKAAAATAEGRFTDEILPIIIPQKKGDRARVRSR